MDLSVCNVAPYSCGILDELPLSMNVGSVPTCFLDARVSRRNKNKLLGTIVGSKLA